MQVYARFSPSHCSHPARHSHALLHLTAHERGAAVEGGGNSRATQIYPNEKSTIPVCVELVDLEEGRGATFECNGVFTSTASSEIEDSDTMPDTWMPSNDLDSQKKVYSISCQRYLTAVRRQNIESREDNSRFAPLVYICYGAAGTGKTFTLFGPSSSLADGLHRSRDEASDRPRLTNLLEHYDVFQAVRQKAAPSDATLPRDAGKGSHSNDWHDFPACIAMAAGWQLAGADQWLREMSGVRSGIAPRLLLDLFQAHHGHSLASSVSGLDIPRSFPASSVATRQCCVWLSCAEHSADGVIDLVSLALQEETKRVSASVGSESFRPIPSSRKPSRMSNDDRDNEARVKIGSRVLLLMEEAFLRFGAWGGAGARPTGSTNGHGEGLHTMATLHALQQRLRWDEEDQGPSSNTYAYHSNGKLSEEEREEVLLRCLAHYQPVQYKTTMATGQLWHRLKGLLFTSPEACWCVLQYILQVYRQSRPTAANPFGSSRSHALVRLVRVEVIEENGRCHVVSDEAPNGAIRQEEVLLVDLAGSERVQVRGGSEEQQQDNASSRFIVSSARVVSSRVSVERGGNRAEDRETASTTIHENPTISPLDRRENTGSSGIDPFFRQSRKTKIEKVEEMSAMDGESEEEYVDSEWHSTPRTPHRRARTAYRHRQKGWSIVVEREHSDSGREAQKENTADLDGHGSAQRNPHSDGTTPPRRNPSGSPVATRSVLGSAPLFPTEEGWIQPKFIPLPLPPPPPPALVLRETQHVNTSLLALRRLVQQWSVASLREVASQRNGSTTRRENAAGGVPRNSPRGSSSSKPIFLPFKENPLTAMLEPFLRPESGLRGRSVSRNRNGASKTSVTDIKHSRVVMMLCCSLMASDFSETLVSLRLGADAMDLERAIKEREEESFLSPRSKENHSRSRSRRPQNGGVRDQQSAMKSPQRATLVSEKETAVKVGEELGEELQHSSVSDANRRYHHRPVSCDEPRFDAIPIPLDSAMSTIPIPRQTIIGNSGNPSHRSPCGRATGTEGDADEARDKDDQLAYYERVVQMLYDQCTTVTQRYQESVDEVEQVTSLMVKKDEENQRLKSEVLHLRKRLERYEGSPAT